MDELLFEDFLEVERTHWWFQARREILLGVIDRFLPPGSSILDVGSGTGFLLERLGTAYRAFGLDPSDTAVRMCRERGLTNVAHGTIGDAMKLPDAPFDGVSFFDVIEHLDDDVGALRGARAVLRDNGVVFVTVPAYQFLWSAHDDLNNHRRRYVARQLRAVVESAGFRVEALAYFNSLLFPAAVARRLGGRLLGSHNSREFEPLTPWLNEVMRRVFVLERGVVRRASTSRFAFRFPFGLSILCVGRRA